MTYPYGTKTAPTVGRGLGGLPRRAATGGVSVEEFTQSTLTNSCQVGDLLYTNEISGNAVALDLASAPTGTLGAVNPIASAYLKETYTSSYKYISQSVVTEEYATVSISSQTATIVIYNSDNTVLQSISHSVSSFNSGGVDDPENDYAHVLFFPSSEKFLFFTQGRDSNSYKYAYFAIYEKISGTYTEQGEWRSSSLGDSSPRLRYVAIDENNSYVYFLNADFPSVAGGTSRLFARRTTFSTNGHTDLTSGGGGEYDYSRYGAVDVNNGFIYLDRQAWNGSQWVLTLRVFNLSGGSIRTTASLASNSNSSYSSSRQVSVSSATGIVTMLYRTGSSSHTVRRLPAGATNSGNTNGISFSSPNFVYPPINRQDGSWYVVYISNYSSVGALYLVSPDNSATIINAPSGVTSGAFFVGNNNDIHLFDTSTNTRYQYALFEDGSYQFTGIATEAGSANDSVETRINGLITLSGNAFIDSSAGGGAIMVASGGKALLSTLDL